MPGNFKVFNLEKDGRVTQENGDRVSLKGGDQITLNEDDRVTPENGEQKKFQFSDGSIWWSTLVLLCVTSLFTRLHCVTQPYAVVWDETHFGKMVSWYINGTYFNDVHPPGGKLMLTFFGWVGGYNGSHEFKEPGMSYEGYDGIMMMRIVCAIMGASTVPMAFETVWLLTGNLKSAVLGAVLVLADSGSLTLTKFILLDAPLFFFMMASLMGMAMIHHNTQRNGCFSSSWWLSLFFTGMMIGCVISVKFVGLFTVAAVGLFTVHSLWELFSECNWVTFVKVFLANALCLIVLPFAIYFTFFVIHDKLLYRTHSALGASEAALSPEYQMQLVGNSLHNLSQAPDVAYGSWVSLRNDAMTGPYLHSHALKYPEKEVPGNLQQVTGYKAKDSNNYFQIFYPYDDPEMSNNFYAGPPEFLSEGDIIRLHHVNTNTMLAVSNVLSPLNKRNRVVYAENYTIEAYDPKEDFNPFINFSGEEEETPRHLLWKVQATGESKVIKVLESRFRLVNLQYGCTLMWTLETLPKKWGEGQEEINCIKNSRDSKTKWRFEIHQNPYLEDLFEPVVSSYSVLDRFIETHQLQRFTNALLKPSAEDAHSPMLQKPWMWPLCYKSQPWYDIRYRIVLLGNPFVFWFNLVNIIGIPVFLLVRSFKSRRNQSYEDDGFHRIEFSCKLLFVCYLLHYLPFYTMSRILYLHHYFPALLISCLLTGVFTGHFIDRAGVTLGPILFLMLTAFTMYTFSLYCYVGYGVETTDIFHLSNSTFKDVRFLDTWFI